MRGSLKGIRARVDRIAAEHERRQGETSAAQLVAILQSARIQEPRASWDGWTDEEARESGRALRVKLREAGWRT